MKRYLFETNFSKKKFVFILDVDSGLYVEISALHRVYFWGDNCIFLLQNLVTFLSHFFANLESWLIIFRNNKKFFFSIIWSQIFFGSSIRCLLPRKTIVDNIIDKQCHNSIFCKILVKIAKIISKNA